MSHDQDQQDIDKVIKGDTLAFSVLVDRYKHMVFTLAVKILKNREEAEEVSQDVFVKVYERIDTFKGESKLSTWIYRIAYNRSLDYLKKQGRTLNTLSVDSETEYHVETIDNALETMETAERKQVIKASISELPEEDAIVITLHYFEELSLKEISKVMGLQPNTVKVRLFRSRKRLAEILKNKLDLDTLQSYGRKEK